MQHDTSKGNNSNTELSRTHEATPVLGPVEVCLKHKNLAGHRKSFLKQLVSYRKSYLEELEEALEDVVAEIEKEELPSSLLALLNTKYALERNILAEERNLLSEERSLLAEKRTAQALKRTEMAENRSGLARIRTLLAKNRSFLAEKRTIMAQQRTFLAKARTELAFIRTGVAFIALATGLMRYFGFGWWTITDAIIFVLGMAMVSTGIYYYLPTRRQEGRLIDLIRQKEEELMGKKPRVMVLDDDPTVCKTLKLYLTKEGYEVEAFVDPFAAKERLETTEFDVVITDLMMEGMDGFQILKLIKRLSPNTQVIMITYIGTSQHILKAMREDLFDYLVKPVNIEELKDSVRRALEKKRFELERAD